MYLFILLLKLFSAFIDFEFIGNYDYERFVNLNFIVFDRIDFELNLFVVPVCYDPI